MESKKFITSVRILSILFACLFLLALYGCTSPAEENKPTNENPIMYEEDSNALFVCMGKTIEINGHTITAEMLAFRDDGSVYSTSTSCVFYVDRMNGDVYIKVREGYERSATMAFTKTAYKYTGDLIVNGGQIPWLVEPENWQ